MAEKCATAQQRKTTQTKADGNTAQTTPSANSVKLCGEEVRKGNYNAKITYSHLLEWI